MNQFKVGLADDLRRILNDRADAAGHSVAEEIRELLWAGLAARTINPVNSDWEREASLTNAAWESFFGKVA